MITDWEKAEETQRVCYCIGVDKKRIVEAIQAGSDTLAKIKSTTDACTGDRCKELNPSGQCCFKDIKKLIALYAKREDTGSCSCCSH